MSYLAAGRFASTKVMEGELDSSSNETWEFFNNIVRFRVANSLLRPLSEGLALFAEHDIFPGDSEIISTPMAALSRWFTAKDSTEQSGRDGVQKDLASLLLAQRTSQSAESRKIQLLSQPLQYDGQSAAGGVAGGYLAGYLTIKNLRTTLLRGGRMKFIDPDFFLCFVRSYIFDDFGLVELILAPIASEEKYASDLFNYLQLRLQSLAIETSSEKAEAYEQWILNPKLREDTSQSPLQSKKSSIQAAQRALEKMHLDLNSEEDCTDLERGLKYLDRWTLTQRHLICVASCQCEVKITATNAIVEATGTDGMRIPVLSLPLHELKAVPSGKGTCECYVSTEANLFAVVVSVHGKLVACFHLTDTEEAMKRDFVDYQFDLLHAEEAESRSAKVIEHVMDQMGVDDFLKELLSSVENAADTLYRKYALIFVPDELTDEVGAVMGHRGVLSLLEGDLSTLEGLASLSLMASMTGHAESIQDLLLLRGHDMGALRADVKSRLTKSGFHILYELDDVVFSAI